MNDPRAPGDLPELAEAYRRTPAPGPEGRARLAARLRSEPPPRRGWVWNPSPGALGMRTPAAVAFAALLLVAGFALGRIARAPGVAGHAPTSPDATRIMDSAGEPAGAVATRGELVVEFVLVAPNAASVAVVGDFNGWDPSRTPMRRVDEAGPWTARVPLPEGRRVYAFVVDGDRWVPDPVAPLAPADEFGAARSVIVVSANGI